MPTSASAWLGKSRVEDSTPSVIQPLTIRRKANGHSLDELPYQAALGDLGSYLCVLINVLALIASFYTALFPVSGDAPTASAFFQAYLAGPLLIFLFLAWKVYSWFTRPSDRPLYVKIKDIDIYTGMRQNQRELISGPGVDENTRRASIQEIQDEKKKKGVKGYFMGAVHSVF